MKDPDDDDGMEIAMIEEEESLPASQNEHEDDYTDG